MSTELKSIKGRYEDTRNSIKRKVTYDETELLITRFSGGKKNGAMIQLTPEQGYIQLTKDQVKELIVVLQDAFDYDKNPSE